MSFVCALCKRQVQAVRYGVDVSVFSQKYNVLLCLYYINIEHYRKCVYVI